MVGSVETIGRYRDMALFTSKVDQDLPLLTQIQQVRLADENGQPEDTELMNFLLVWMKRN